MSITDLTGKKFHRLTVVSMAKISSTRNSRWNCRCACGEKSVVKSGDLKNGHTKSCGCLKKELVANRLRTHGMTRSSEYRSWCLMKGRCLNEKSQDYKYYGGRGIKVCERWLEFESFYADMGMKPSPKHSIDRINNNGNYEPSNCRWATKTEQSRNQRVRNGSVSGIAGVSNLPSGAWRANIGVDGKQIHLYEGRSFEAACRLRIEAEGKYWEAS